MLFNLHNGQIRFGAMDKGSIPYFRPTMKVGSISIKKVMGVQGKIEHHGGYQTDKLGNIDVRIPFHIDIMVGHGWPIYNGDGIREPGKMDLIYPTNDLTSPYWQKINEAKNAGGNHG